MENFRIDQSSNIPIVHQISRMVRGKIVRGEIEVGKYLPSVRELAGTLQINFNTVAKSYRQLEKEDLIEIKHGLGARVKMREQSDQALKSKTQLFGDLEDVICHLSLDGADQEQVVDFFAEALGQHFVEDETA